MPLNIDRSRLYEFLDDFRLRNSEIINEHKESAFDQINYHFKNILHEFNPLMPARSILLSIQSGHTKIIPLPYAVDGPSISNNTTGWNNLLRSLILEPCKWYIHLKSDRIELIEYLQGNCRTIISLSISGELRPIAIRRFLASAKRIYRHDPGPVVILGNGDGIMELDCWIISNHLTITASIHNGIIKKQEKWWQTVEASERAAFWRDEWIRLQIEKAIRSKKWITTANEIENAISQNRVDMIINPCASLKMLSEKDHVFIQLLKHKPNMFNSCQNDSGIILI